MKKVILVLIFAMSIYIVNAQKSKVVSAYNYIKPQYNELAKAQEAIDAAVVHESTANSEKAWYYRGMVYHAIFQSTDENFRDLHETPLREAVDSYIKAYELDEKGKYKDDIVTRLKTASVQFLNKGIGDFNAQEYALAMQAFENAVYVTSHEIINEIDTMAVFNAAIAADRAENFEKAVEFYAKTAEMRYEGSKVYLFLSNAYKAKGDTASSLDALKQGIEAWPEDNNILMVDMINYYLTANKTEDALEYLFKAVEKDPENYSYLFAIGTLYDKKQKYDEAIEYYAKTLAIKEDFFDAQYNLGAVYYNKAVAHYTAANDIPPSDQAGYDAEIASAKEQLKLAQPYLERAYELNDSDISTIQSLKEIYVRLQMYDKSKELKARLDELGTGN
jgi:tetratricopeptide (TPR) repeat protein